MGDRRAGGSRPAGPGARERDLVDLERVNPGSARQDVTDGQHPPDHLARGAALQGDHGRNPERVVTELDGRGQPQGAPLLEHPSQDDVRPLLGAVLLDPPLQHTGVHHGLGRHPRDPAARQRLDLDRQDPTLGIDGQGVALVAEPCRSPTNDSRSVLESLQDRRLAFLEERLLGPWFLKDGVTSRSRIAWVVSGYDDSAAWTAPSL